MKRHPLALALWLVLSAAPRAAACPACAGDPEEGTPWALIGVFVLVPIAVAAAAGVLIRRELRSTR